MVANITKKIGEWSVRETAGEYAVLSQGNLEEKTEGNRALGAEENRALGGPRSPTGEGNRGLFPTGSERPALDPEEVYDVEILERPDKRSKAEKIKKLGGTPKQRREQIRATLLPGYYVCESGGLFLFRTSRHRRPFTRNIHQGLQVVRLKGDHKGIR